MATYLGEPERINTLRRVEQKATAIFYCTKCLAHASITDREIIYIYPKVKK